LHIDVEVYSCVLATANMNYEHDEFSGCFRFGAKPEWSLVVQRVMKRAIDIAIGLIGSAITVLLTPIVFVLVNLEDRGPVFYMREFVGSDGKIHYYRKFRTMLNDADGILRRDPELKAEFILQYKLKDDPRLLRVGQFMRRFSLDEFPQFFSVLSGKLTFVGPRVISAEEKQCYGTLLPKLLSFRPGLTGFWQVMGRQTTTYQERVHMDMFYIDRWSIWLDLVIIAKTFWKVLKTEGAY
jgi:lipopolysaccharide/colanic/teichoic acid biosynthesis glycosyltransferase